MLNLDFSMHFVKILYLICILFACAKSEEVKNILVFGHAGMGLSMDNSIYHDNSKEAVSLALNLPTSNGVEVDVRFGADGTLWLYHDEWLEAESSGKGCVSELNDLQLSSLSYQTLKHEKLVKLMDVLPLLNDGQMLFVDLKQFNSCRNENVDFEELMDAFEDQLAEYQTRVKIICSYKSWLNDLAQQYEVLYSTDDFEEGKEVLLTHSLVKGLVVRNAAIKTQGVLWVKDQQKEVYLYDIRSLKGIRQAFDKNPTGILADDLRKALAERGYAL
jgi:glycerophosphoryl diester phosphodiesterase